MTLAITISFLVGLTELLLGLCGEGSEGETEEDLSKTRSQRDIVNPTPKVLDRLSADASVVFLPFRLRGNQPVGPFGGRLDTILECLPIVALTLAAEAIDLDAEPEEGEAGQAARLQDTLADLERLAGQTALEAEKTADKANKLRAEYNSRQSAGADDVTTLSRTWQPM